MTAATSHLIPPHGGELIQLIAPPERIAELRTQSKGWPSWDLTARQLCDLELLVTGGFSPLRGFMTRADYEGVCHNMRLANGMLWPMPVTLDVTEEFARKLTPGASKIALRDPEGVMLAVLHVEEVWQPDRKAEAQAVFASTSAAREFSKSSRAFRTLMRFRPTPKSPSTPANCPLKSRRRRSSFIWRGKVSSERPRSRSKRVLSWIY